MPRELKQGLHRKEMIGNVNCPLFCAYLKFSTKSPFTPGNSFLDIPGVSNTMLLSVCIRVHFYYPAVDTIRILAEGY
jgi:hypothetical protein